MVTQNESVRDQLFSLMDPSTQFFNRDKNPLPQFQPETMRQLLDTFDDRYEADQHGNSWLNTALEITAMLPSFLINCQVNCPHALALALEAEDGDASQLDSFTITHELLDRADARGAQSGGGDALLHERVKLAARIFRAEYDY